MTLVDFGLYAHARPHFSRLEFALIGRSMFPFSEAIRLWLQEQPLDAPFGKIAVELQSDGGDDALRHRTAVCALGVCEAYVAVSPDELKCSAGDYLWLSQKVSVALDGIERSLSWSSASLARRVAEVGTSEPVCDFELARLRRVDRSSGVTCMTRFRATRERTSVVVEFVRNGSASTYVELLASNEPFTLDDEFPARSAKTAGGRYSLMDRNRKVLGEAPIPRVP